MIYDDVCSLAKRLRYGSQIDKTNSFNTLNRMDIDELVDVMETSRMILAENEGDGQLYNAVTDLIGYVDTIQQSKTVGSAFHEFLELFKQR